ncbi:MAG: hypothetical protein KJ607_07785 [Bacteroidetes bacterium]|nr:hypothetical protein [Bacteroidota bacterium]
MKHLVEIDDRTKSGQSILLVLKNLSKASNSIVFKSLEEIEEEIDSVFAKKIEEGLKSGTVSRDKVMEALGRK